MEKNGRSRDDLKNTGILIHLVIIASVIVLTPCIALFSFINKDNYYIFTQNRIDEMEDIFQIDFSGIKLESYRVGGYRASLEFSGIENYEDFVENRVNGETAYFFRDNTVYDYFNDTKSEPDSADAEIMRSSRCEAMYYITSANGMDYRICFHEENNGKYSASASYSTWGVCF